MRDDKRFILDGFVFSTRKDYERACKEKETIEYLVANSNMSDMKAVLKIYNKAVEKKSFQTVIGLTRSQYGESQMAFRRKQGQYLIPGCRQGDVQLRGEQ